MSGIAILGAGLAGLSAAYHLKKKEYSLFEKEKEVGGICRSVKRSGYTFDSTGHVLHFKARETSDFVRDLLEGEWFQTERSAWVYTKEKYIPYPFQVYFTQLSDPVRAECLEGFLKARRTGNPPATFEEWLLSRFGSGIARHFLIPYNTKLWGVAPSQLGIDGVQKYIPEPTVEEILSGIPRSLGYNARFHYPLHGGIQQVALAFQRRLRGSVSLGHEVEQIDLENKKIRFANGREFSYRRILSTIPLPELAKRLKPLPPGIQQLFGQLKWVSLLSFHFGINRPQEREKHWIYFAESEFPFYRVVFPSNYAPHLAPVGRGTLQAEVSCFMAMGSHSPASTSDFRASVIRGLMKAGLLLDESQIEVEEIHPLRYGYAVFTPRWEKIIAEIEAFLQRHAITLVGRYASWEYMSLEDCILAGKAAAVRFIDSDTPPVSPRSN